MCFTLTLPRALRNLTCLVLTLPHAHRNLDVKLELGGLPWTCLEGEPTGLNWCNAADAASVYRDPPSAWLSTVGRGKLSLGLGVQDHSQTLFSSIVTGCYL